MTYTTTLKRTRKVNARDEARKRLLDAGADSGGSIMTLIFPKIADLLDHDVEVTEDVEVQHRFKVGDRIDIDRRRWCVTEVSSPSDHSLDWNCDAIYHLTTEGNYDLLDTRIVDRRATLVAPKRVYTVTVEAARPDIIGWSDLLKARINESRETIRGVVSEFQVTDITSEVVE